LNILYGIIAPYKYDSENPMSKRYSSVLLTGDATVVRDMLVGGLGEADRIALACVVTHYGRFTKFGKELCALDPKNTYKAPSCGVPVDSIMAKISNIDAIKAKLPKDLYTMLENGTPLDTIAAVSVYMLRNKIG
jgi:hypothetical protein